MSSNYEDKTPTVLRLSNLLLKHRFMITNNHRGDFILLNHDGSIINRFTTLLSLYWWVEQTLTKD